MAEERSKSPTWRLIAIAVISLLVWAAQYAYTDTRNELNKLRSEKVDLQMFLMLQNDVQEIKGMMRDQNDMMTSHIIESGSGKVRRRHP